MQTTRTDEWIRESHALLQQLDELLAGFNRKVSYDSCWNEGELFQQIDDELSSRHDGNDVNLYSNRLDRFCRNIDYFIDNIAVQAVNRPPHLRRRGTLYSGLKNIE